MWWIFAVVAACVIALWALIAHKLHELRTGAPSETVHRVRSFADMAAGGVYRRIVRIAKQIVRGIGSAIIGFFRALPHILTVIGHRLTDWGISASLAISAFARAIGHKISPRHHRRNLGSLRRFPETRDEAENMS